MMANIIFLKDISKTSNLANGKNPQVLLKNVNKSEYLNIHMLLQLSC